MAVTTVGAYPGSVVAHAGNPVTTIDHAPFISVYEFGAAGDGSTDDSPAFQLALNTLAGSGLTLYVPAGVFKLNSAQVINTAGVPVTLGAGAAFSGTYATSMMASGTPNKARNVVTSLHAYNGTGTGTLTSTANGAWAAQDGVTNAVGDCVFIMPGQTNLTGALDAGPWIISSLGAAGAKWVLVRPSWYQNGIVIPQGLTIDIGGEGTIWAGNAFRAMCAGAQVVGTNDAAFYSRVFKKTVTLASGTYTLGAGGGLEALNLFSTTISSVQCSLNTGAGTLGTNKLAAPVASRVAGYAGTAAVVVNSLVDAGTVAGSDTSTVDVLVTNW